MAIATRPKPSVSHKKRRAQHHRQSKHYLKAYWPYLPILLIVALGAVVNHLWPQAVDLALVPSPLVDSQGEPLTRIQTLAGSQTQGLLVVVIAASAVAFGLFMFSHWYRVHRLLNRGEKFVSEHPWLDIAAVLIFTAGFVLTRTR